MNIVNEGKTVEMNILAPIAASHLECTELNQEKLVKLINSNSINLSKKLDIVASRKLFDKYN